MASVVVVRGPLSALLAVVSHVFILLFVVALSRSVALNTHLLNK